jgi:uncharacterized pyridoxamine 5'-phosphate oxidase family protein
MSKYDEGMNILKERFGGGKDNVITLATVSLDPGANGKVKPAVRDVDAYFEDGVFYVVTHGQSNKMKQINENSNVCVSVPFEDFFSSATAKNLGWVMEPHNAELRIKLREVFKDWYDFANNEMDQNCCYISIQLNKGTLRINHGEAFYIFDFDNKTAE